MPDSLALPVNFGDPVKRNPPHLVGFVQHFKHSALALQKGDLLEGNLVDRSLLLKAKDESLGGAGVSTGQTGCSADHGGLGRLPCRGAADWRLE